MITVKNKKVIGELGPNDIYVGRGTILGNPFPKALFRYDRDIVVSLHKEWFLSQLANNTPVAKLLWSFDHDKDLVCFCAPESCHADLYKEFKDFSVGKDYKQARREFLDLKGYEFLPTLEGKTHINIYSRSRTDLGRLLSNFAHTPFEHDKFGKFESVEGFWFWLSTGRKHDDLRTMFGPSAKSIGSKRERVPIEGFEVFIEEAIRAKVFQNHHILRALAANHLPFKHYYYYGEPTECKCVREGNGLLERIYGKISREIGQSHKVIVAGSRTVKDPKVVFKAICDSGYRISEIVEGGAKGVDTLGYYYGMVNQIPVKTFEVTREEWKKSKGAGMQRNMKMGDYADKGIVIIENNSSGSVQMKDYLLSLGKDVFPVFI